MKKFTVMLLAAVLVLAMLVGCSSGSSTQAKKAKVIDIELTQEEYAFGVDKDQPELLEKVNAFIEKIKTDGTLSAVCDHYFGDGTPVPVKSAAQDDSKADQQLVVATNAEFEPFEYTEGDSYLGIDMEIAKLLADELGMELVISNMDFDAVCLSVGQHKCDIAMAGLTVKEDRKEFVNFSASYYNASQKVVALESDTAFASAKTAEDVEAVIKGKENVKIGVQNGTTGQFYVDGDEDWGFDGLGVKAIGYKNGSLAIQDMLNGNLDYVIIDSAPAAAITTKMNAMN